MSIRFLRMIAATLVLGACGTNPENASGDVGASTPDASGPIQTQPPDAGVPSVVEPDAGALPSPTPDSGTPDSGTVDPGAPTEWPNALSRANSDAWLRANHDRLTVLKPRVLVLDVQRTDDQGKPGTPTDTFVSTLVGAFAEMSKPHGLTTNAAPALQYQVERIIDLRDPTAQYPSFWPPKGAGGFDIGEIFAPAFAPRLGFADPNTPGRFLSMCELFETGRINELWISARAGERNIFENQSRLQRYDAAMNPLAGQFNSCTNGCFYDPQKRVNCKVSVRMQEINRWRGPGCGTHAAGHAFENLRKSVPYLTRANRFLNFEIADFPLTSRSQYGCDYSSSAMASCFAFPQPGTITQGTDGKIPAFSLAWGSGCGNVHFAPNSAFQYNYNSSTPALNSCDDYGQGNGTGGNDRTTTYTAALVQGLEQKFGDCGGGWVTYWGQSFPGPGNTARDENGQPMKNWWPFLFY